MVGAGFRRWTGRLYIFGTRVFVGVGLCQPVFAVFRIEAGAMDASTMDEQVHLDNPDGGRF